MIRFCRHLGRLLWIWVKGMEVKVWVFVEMAKGWRFALEGGSAKDRRTQSCCAGRKKDCCCGMEEVGLESEVCRDEVEVELQGQGEARTGLITSEALK